MRTGLASLMLAALMVGIGAHMTFAHSEWHHNGAQTTARYDGAYASIEVTNANTRPNTNDFVASRLLAKSNVAGDAWIEVGWAEVGFPGTLDPNGLPEQYVYVYDTVHREWHFYNTLCVTSCHVDVRIVKSSSCVIGSPPCVWTAQLYNHTAGAWANLHSVTLPMDRAYLEEFTEVYVDPSQPVTHFAIDLASNDLDWFETQRRFSDGSWNLWVTTNTTTLAVTPYCIDWITSRYVFEAQNGGC